MKVLKGKTHDQLFKHVDLILARMLRRMHKTVVAITPPFPVFNYCERPAEDGTLLRAILPEGRIVRGFMYIGQFAERDEVGFTATISRRDGEFAQDFATRKSLLIINPDIPVATGDRLRFWTRSPTLISDVWVGFLIQVGIKDAIKEQIVIDELEANYARNKEEIIVGESEG